MKRLAKFFLLVYLFIFPLGQLARLPVDFLGPEIRIYLGDVLVGLAVGTWLIWKGKRVEKGKRGNRGKEKGDRGNQGRIGRPILVFTGVATLSLLVNIPRLNSKETLVASFYLVRWIVYAGLYFVVSDLARGKAQSAKPSHNSSSLPDPQPTTHNSLLNLLIFVGGITAIFGLLQYLWFPDLRVWLEAGNWDPHYFRVYGTFLDPGYFGMIMVLTLILVVTRLFARIKTRQSKIIPFSSINYKQSLVSSEIQLSTISYYVLLITCYLALALSYSRSSYLAYLVGMGVIAWKLKKPKFYGAVLGIFLMTVLLLPRPGGEGVRLEREASIKARIENWKQSLTIARDHPILGVGFNAYRYAQRDYGFLDLEEWQETHAGAGSDSSLLFVLATTGIVGLGAYLWLLRKIFIAHNPQLTTRPTTHNPQLTPYPVISLAILSSVIALLAHSLFLNSLFYPWIMGWMWILFASI